MSWTNSTEGSGEVSESRKGSLKKQEKMPMECTDSIVTITSARTVLRVRIVNQISGLFKDLLVDIRNDLNLFDAIYDNNSVKKANVRKWGKRMSQQVKNGSHEIRCSIWDDEVNAPCHTYSIDDMKQTTTTGLYHLVGPEGGLIKLVLQCSEKATTTIVTNPMSMPTSNFVEHGGGNGLQGLTSPCIASIGDSKSSESIPPELSAKKGFHHPYISKIESHSGTFRCPFSGIAVDESVLKEFNDKVRDRDATAKHRRDLSHDSIHQSALATDTVSDLDENDNSTLRTETIIGVNDAYSISQSVLTAESNMRVKITNESSRRYKYLVVDINSDLTIHESIYEHKGVISAQVRKWTPEIVRGVRNKTKEIQCALLDGSLDGTVVQTYSLDDLKNSSTRDLFDLAPKSNPIHLLLRCIEKHVPNLQNSINDDIHTRLSGIPKSASTRTLPRRYTSGSETSLDRLLSSTKRSRPNHMNLSGIRNATFFTTASPTGIKTTGSLSGRRDSFPSNNNSKSFRSRVTTESSSNLQEISCLAPTKTSSNSNGDLKTDDTSPLDSTSRRPFSRSLRGFSSVPLMDINKMKSPVQRRASVHGDCTRFRGKLSEFRRLRNSKMGVEFHSGGNLDKATRKKSNSEMSPLAGAQNSKFTIPFFNGLKDLFSDSLDRTHPQSNEERSMASSSKRSSLKDSERINRFLTFGANRKMPIEVPVGKSNLENYKIHPQTGLTKKSLSMGNSQASVGTAKSSAPPIAEINVVKSRSRYGSGKIDPPSIALSGDLVKEVFPYHVVIDENFNIIQIGNNLSHLMENRELIGKCISDIFVITGPIPSFGKKWDWDLLEKMKEQIIFLEGVDENSSHQKPKVKGSIIELSKRQILLSLSPNVKNLSELESMNLSISDLPIHSCQRDAVLLGEHSKSEVKLTNHLDLLHRELIDSMEKQIEDRTDELATANRNLESANAQLAGQKAKQLEHFACMSHEIRTPLNCIVGMSSLLLEDSESAGGPAIDPMHADSIRMINTSGELLRAVVDDVLDYAKLESGSFEVDIKPTKLQDTIDSVLYSISQKFKEKNVRLRPHFEPTVPEYIETDNRRLQQVLFNLLGNAGKFSKPDSVIDLSVRVVTSSSDNPTSEECGSRVFLRFSVRDYGKGIDKKDFETIFQPFSQASKETQNIYGGTGLGLSITSKLVHRLGGKISLDSVLGKFSDFSVDLPMDGKCVDVEKISNSLKNTTIVVVEQKQEDNHSPVQSHVRAEPVPLNVDVVEAYGLRVLRCTNWEELQSKTSREKAQTPRGHFTFLVHESLYHLCSAEPFESVFGKHPHAVITYGTNFLVEKTKAFHLKSLTGLFPVTLLASIARQVSAQANADPGGATLPTAGTGPGSEERPVPESPALSAGLWGSPRGRDGTSKGFQHGLKVLYAEDNLVNQKVLTRVLNRYGISDVTVVDNGRKAVDVSAKTRYDCILLDIQMPVMGGMEACRLITERDPDAIIIFVTAHALDEFRVRAKAAGARGFISKPFRLGDIDDVLTDIYRTA